MASSSARREWRWEDEELTRELVAQLQRGEALETRAFLRPIFRCMKHGVHKSGARDDALVEMAFAFADWMAQLAAEGDAARGLARMPALQPSYALNTIVTAGQRAGSRPDAERAFRRLLALGFEPDVFTFTALIDVMARSGDVAAALEVYAQMRATKSRPNIVTFTTLIRAVGGDRSSAAVDPLECLRFLRDARQEERFDDSLLWEALEACAARQSLGSVTAVLRELARCGQSVERDSGRVVRALSRVALADVAGEACAAQWLAEALVTADEHARITSADACVSISAAKAVRCLGEQTSDSVRLAVVQHDITRLAERLRDGVSVSTNDFETLIHQCRKRKWTDGVALIVDAMRQMAETGWDLAAYSEAADVATVATTSAHAADAAGRFVPAQPHLRPTGKTFVSVVDAYMVCGEEQMAWDAVLEVSLDAALTREPAMYRKFIRGAYLLNKCAHVAELLAFAREDNVAPTHRACVEVARMYGYEHEEGVATILERLPLPASLGAAAAAEKRQALFEELVMSCGFKRNAVGVEATLRSMLARGFRRSALTENGVIICCLQHADLGGATRTLRHFQRLGLVLEVPMYDSLLRELYYKYTRRGGEFDETSRKLALRTLYSRRALFTQLFAEADALERWAESSRRSSNSGDGETTSGSNSSCSTGTSSTNSDTGTSSDTNVPATALDSPSPESSPEHQHHQRALGYWCERAALECSALMFAQHAIELIATIRDKATKAAAQAALYRALLRTPDPFLFNLRAVAALPHLDVTFRSIGKLAKQLLQVLSDNGAAVEVQAHHAAFCVAQLPSLTVHIFKEIDDVVALHASHRAEVLSFCYDALENDNMDKTIGYLVHREGLYTLATAEYLAPKLAELYVLQEQITVLQFFKPEVADSAAIRRLFLREVIEVETIADEEAAAEEEQEDEDEDGEEGDGGSRAQTNKTTDLADGTGARARRRYQFTIKAIVEFKLQHEDEFMPYLLHRPTRVIRTDDELAAAEDPQKEYLRLPLDDSRVVIVDNDDAVALAYEVLMHESMDAVGLDAEWRPDAGRGDVPSKCSVLQVACETHVFLFDLLELSLSDVEELFAHMFGSPSVVKLGFGLDGDIKRLRWSFPDSRCFDSFVNVLDFSLEDDGDGVHVGGGGDSRGASSDPLGASSGGSCDSDGGAGTSITKTTDARQETGSFEIAKLKHRRRRPRGLAAYVLEVLGLPLSKAQQRSDWERRPLTVRQISYAALDAYCLIMVHRALQAAHQ